MASSTTPATPTNETTIPPRRRWQLWWSAKIFLAVNAVVLIVGLLAVYSRLANFEAVKCEVERVGGQYMAVPKIPDFIPKWAKWHWVEEFYSEFEVISLSDSKNEVNEQFTDDSLRIVVSGPKVKQLSLNHSRITDSGLKYLHHQSELESLMLEGTSITDEGIKLLENHVHLTSLGLSETKVTDAALRSVRKLPKIDWLSLDRCPNITDQGIHAIRDLPLQVLFVESPQITDEGLSVIAQFPRLKTLGLDVGRFAPESLDKLKPKSTLECVYVGGAGCRDEHLQKICEISSLTRIRLADLKLDEPGARHLLNIQNLRTLICERVQFTDAAVEQLAQQQQLINLLVYETNLTDAQFERLTPLQGSLRAMMLGRTEATDEKLVHLKKFSGLTSLSLVGDEITDSGIANLRGMASLTTLRLVDVYVTDNGIDSLCSLPSLGYLVITRTKITEAGRDRLQKMLPKARIDYSKE